MRNSLNSHFLFVITLFSEYVPIMITASPRFHAFQCLTDWWQILPELFDLLTDYHQLVNKWIWEDQKGFHFVN